MQKGKRSREDVFRMLRGISGTCQEVGGSTSHANGQISNNQNKERLINKPRLYDYCRLSMQLTTHNISRKWNNSDHAYCYCQ